MNAGRQAHATLMPCVKIQLAPSHVHVTLGILEMVNSVLVGSFYGNSHCDF